MARTRQSVHAGSVAYVALMDAGSLLQPARRPLLARLRRLLLPKQQSSGPLHPDAVPQQQRPQVPPAEAAAVPLASATACVTGPACPCKTVARPAHPCCAGGAVCWLHA